MSEIDHKSKEKIRARIENLRIGNAEKGHKKHIFLCTGESCSGPVQGEESWRHLKERLSALNLAPGSVYRTKVGCLRICAGGPIGLVYPEGTWYRGLTPEAIDRVIDQHLVGDCPVEDLLIAVHALDESHEGKSSSSSPEDKV